MPVLIGLLALGALLAAVVLVARRRGPRSDLPCATCRHCGRLFDDGVLCRFGHREVFKTEAHIANCIDWEARGKRTR